MRPKKSPSSFIRSNSKLQQSYSLGELSISQIGQRQFQNESFNFQQEKELINQIQNKYGYISNEYGFQSPQKQFTFGKKSQHTHTEQNRLTDGNSKQKRLCFNKQIKRKKTLSKSKQKQPLLSQSILSTSHSLDKKIFKPVKTTTIQNKQSARKVYIAFQKKQKSMKAATVKVKLFEAPLKSSEFQNRQQKIQKIYYQLPDDFKIEVIDLNNNLCTELSKPEEKASSKFIYHFDDLKKSYLSKQQERKTTNQNNSKTNQNLELSSESCKIFQVKRPLSLGCKDSSFNSSRTSKQQSPFSNSSGSTATHRVIRRNQILGQCKGQQEEYFLRPISGSKFYY